MERWLATVTSAFLYVCLPTQSFALYGGWKVIDPKDPTLKSCAVISNDGSAGCSATIIRYDKDTKRGVILTTAHCALDEKATGVRFGTKFSSSVELPIVDQKIWSFHPHKEPKKGGSAYDLSAMAFTGELPPSYGPAEVQQYMVGFEKDNKAIHFAGYGYSSETFHTRGILYKAWASVKEIRGTLAVAEFRDQSIYLGSFDSGGPLFVWNEDRMKLIGVVNAYKTDILTNQPTATFYAIWLDHFLTREFLRDNVDELMDPPASTANLVKK